MNHSTTHREEMNMKELELFDGCSMLVKTNAKTIEDFLKEVPTRYDAIDGKQFFYEDAWYPAFDLDFI